MVSNFEGPWSGVVVRRTCQLNGALGRRITPRLCPAGPNQRYPMSLTVSQPAPSFTQVTAVVNLANTILNASGTVSNDGQLLLGGDTEYVLPDPVSKRAEIVRYSLLKWNTRLVGFTLTLIGGRFDRNPQKASGKEMCMRNTKLSRCAETRRDRDALITLRASPAASENYRLFLFALGFGLDVVRFAGSFARTTSDSS